MTDRDRALLDMRPLIPSKPASDAEAFLHTTLRPVLKLQNDTLLALVAADVRKRVPGFASFAPDDQRQRLRAMLKKDSRLKRVLQGVVMGAMTTAEVATALADEAEIRRRMMTLLVERVTSQTDRVSDLASRSSSVHV